MKLTLDSIKTKIIENTIKGSKTYYRPLDKEGSNLIRNYYASNISLPLSGNNDIKFYTKSGTLIATGYTRVVIGDYGAYIEFKQEQIKLSTIKSKWAGEPKRPVKYIWMETIDASRVKVYYQKGKVAYADYIPGMYYIDSQELNYELVEVK